jgi:protein-disulfide isomerase
MTRQVVSLFFGILLFIVLFLPMVLAETSPVLGDPNAPIQITEFTDFECPFCASVQPTLNRIRNVYGDQVQFKFKHFPLPMHRNANSAHLASLCAEEQDRFWEYRFQLFRHQRALNKKLYLGLAKELGLDLAQFETCVGEMRYQFRIDQDMEEAFRAGVSGTPAFMINSNLISGAQPFEVFEQIIDAELRAYAF